MTWQMLKGMRVKNKQELVERVYTYFDKLNETLVEFHRTYKMKKFESDPTQKK